MRALLFRALAGLVQGFFFVVGERAALVVLNAWRDGMARRHPFPGSSETDYFKIWPHG